MHRLTDDTEAISAQTLARSIGAVDYLLGQSTVSTSSGSWDILDSKNESSSQTVFHSGIHSSHHLSHFYDPANQPVKGHHHRSNYVSTRDRRFISLEDSDNGYAQLRNTNEFSPSTAASVDDTIKSYGNVSSSLPFQNNRYPYTHDNINDNSVFEVLPYLGNYGNMFDVPALDQNFGKALLSRNTLT